MSKTLRVYDRTDLIGITNAMTVGIPDDANDLTIPGGNIVRGVYVGVSGNLNVILVGDDNPVTLYNLAAGVWHPIQVRRILATSTSAQNIVVGW